MDFTSTIRPTWQPLLSKSHLYIERYREFVNSRFQLRLQHGVDESIPIPQKPEFYHGSRLNYAENSLLGHGIAIKCLSESDPGHATLVSWDNLRSQVRRMASALRASGLRNGDVVAFIGTNTSHPLVVFLAAASIGAIFTSLAPDMGEKAIIDRLVQVQPKFLFADTAYRYKGKLYDCTDKVGRVVQTLQTKAGLRVAVLIEHRSETTRHLLGCMNDAISYDKFVSQWSNDDSLVFEQVPFDHPMIILFSSGTTGAPKGMVHSHGGTLINLKKEHILHNNMDSTDCYYHYSNIGWTMWNIAIGGLVSGATILLYDGSPFYPTPEQHIKDITSHGVTVFGGSPRYFAELMKLNIVPSEFSNLHRLRLLHSSGAVLSASLWEWMADAFDGKPIMSFSGGTELCGSILHGLLTQPHFAGEITTKALGIDADIFDENGNSCKPGESGELVIKQAFPNAAVKFWNDVDGSRYKAEYFEGHEGVWTHGDFVKRNPQTGGLIMLGRSDGVLNPSGVRFGASEIYAIMTHFDDIIEDSLCVGQKMADQEERVLLFVQMCPSLTLSKDIINQIRQQISTALSPRHAPKEIIAVPKVPYNVNGKKLEVPVKRILSGRALDSRMKTTLAADADMEFFVRFAEQQRRSDGLRAKL